MAPRGDGIQENFFDPPIKRESNPLAVDGHLAEDRIIDVLDALRSSLEISGGAPWQKAYATEHRGKEDRFGIDIFIEDYFGRKYPLQVKVHEIHEAKFQKRFQATQRTADFKSFLRNNPNIIFHHNLSGEIMIPVYIGTRKDTVAEVLSQLQELYPEIFEDHRVTNMITSIRNGTISPRRRLDTDRPGRTRR